MKTSWEQISVRDINDGDIENMIRYWFQAPPGFMKAMRIDESQLGSADDFRRNYKAQAEAQKVDPSIKFKTLIIERDGRPIGMHTLTHLQENVSAVMHAHIWTSEYRGLGVGRISYLKAAQVNFDKFNLEKLLFRTPKVNKGANRIKEFWGLLPVGEGVIDAPVVLPGTEAWFYELSKERLLELIETVKLKVKESK